MIIVTVMLLQIPGVQHAIAQKAVSMISEKTNTRIEIGSLAIAFTHSIVLEDLYVEGLRKDTLLFVRSVAVDVNLLGLLSREIVLTNIRIDSLTAHISRSLSDSSFNFDFILTALGSDTSGAENVPDTSSHSAWQIQFGTIHLNGIHASYDDDVSGMNVRLDLGTLQTTVDTFDLATKRFHIGAVQIANISAHVVQTGESTPDTSTGSSINIGFGTIALENIRTTYENTAAGDRYRFDLGKLTLAAESIDLPSRHIALNEFSLNSSSIHIERSKRSEKKNSAAETAPSAETPWTISLGSLSLDNNTVQYEVRGAEKSAGVDPNHLRLNGLTLHAEKIRFAKNHIAAEIGHTSFREQSGLELRELKGTIVIDSVHARGTDLTVETAGSQLHHNILLRYGSLADLEKLSGSVNITASVDDSHIAVSEILSFFPAIPLKNSPGAVIRFSSTLSGSIGDLRVDDFLVTTGNSTMLDLSGSIRGLPDVETAHYTVALRQLSTGQRDIQLLLPDTLVPKSIVIPVSIRLSGEFEGTITNFAASADAATSIGMIQAHGELHSGDGTDTARWKSDILVKEFDVGALTGDSVTFGPVSLNASATGTGVTIDDIIAQVHIAVEKAVVFGYPYSRLTIDGTASPTMFDGRAVMKDTNIAFTYAGIINMDTTHPEYTFMLTLEGADLHALHFTDDDIRISGVMTSDMAGEDINDINGIVDIRDVVIVKNNKRYSIDSLVYVSVNIDNQTHISIESTILAGQFDGTITPGELPEVLKDHFNNYFTLHGAQSKKKPSAQVFSFLLNVRDPSTITDIFLPELRSVSVGTIAGNFDSEKKSLNVTVELPGLRYDEFTVDSLSLRVISDPDMLQAAVSIRSISDSTFRITNLRMTGNGGNDTIQCAVQSTDDGGSVKMLLAGMFTSIAEGYEFRFNRNGVMFHDVPWTINPDHYIRFEAARFVAHNVLWRGVGQSMSLNSSDLAEKQPPLKIEFNDFDLGSLSKIVEREPGLLGGMLNGNIMLQFPEKHMAFTSDLTFKDFTFRSQPIGTIAVRAHNRTENVFDVAMDISGSGNRIAMAGKYRSTATGSVIDLTCDVTALNLASVEPFTFGAVTRLSGIMSGSVRMTGTIARPSITGELRFAKTGFNPTFLDSYLRLNDGAILFGGREIGFRSIDLIDTLGNIATLRGRLFTEEYRSFSYDIRIHTENFLLLNKPQSRDALFYGTIFLNSDISVKGDQKKQVVAMTAEMMKGSNLAVVMPESELAIEERHGIIRFVDTRAPVNTIMSRRNPGALDDTTDVKRSTMELTSNISVNKNSKLRILIDPIAGDSLVIRGEATLSLTVDQSGKISLTGRYEILEGSYQLSFGDFIRREFAIAHGSSLTWFGSPLDAGVDITAIYTVKTSVLDLVQSQLSSMSQEERNKYKQEIPIQVHLMMTGKLLTPEIRFKLDLPPDKKGVLNGTVLAKLNELNGQESELNKQVFALLILGRFIAENPLASADGNDGLTDFARSSASQILSTQLNRLSGKYIKGVSVNVGLESYQDYSTGTAEGRTQMQLALSKKLFDERVTVEVGGNVELEGERSQRNMLNNFAGDIKVLYSLTEDGRWQVLAFRRNAYEGPIDGDITKTGVGVLFMIDFNELFGNSVKPISE
ncbi:MAG: translocation/assembly module TamB domain-containing protein [Bacteroidota bacterium]